MPDLRALERSTPGRSATPSASPSAAPALGMAGPGNSLRPDTLALSPEARQRAASSPRALAEASPETEAAESAVRAELAPVFERLRGGEKAPFAVQALRYADVVAGGRETQLVFERDAGTLMPTVPNYFKPQVDPQTGLTNLALREARLRMSAGRYDIIFSLDGEGRPSLDKLMLDGRDITRIAGDWVKQRIRENPAVWGTAAAVAAVGAVAAAHEHVGRTGKPLGFSLGNVKLYGGDHLEVKLRPRAELTGDSRFVRATGAELGATYRDGALTVSGGVRYHVPQRATEVVATMGYQVNPSTTLSAYATHNAHTRQTAAGLLLQSTF
ncbi:MAG: hypothetical protein VKS61_12045 [Candidatus Sericytochromatia bacterium]|nr:hypothetical protein [Candidatus Sericytochromatia bacterium]